MNGIVRSTAAAVRLRACPVPKKLPGVFYRDFNSPSRGVSFDHFRDARALFRGDERDIETGSRFIADEDDGDGCRAGDGVPRALFETHHLR